MKRIVPVLLAIIFFFSGAKVSAADKNELNFEKARKSLLENSRVLKSFDLSKKKLEFQYESALRNADNIAKVLEKWAGFINDYDEMQMIKQRDLIPEQIHYNIEFMDYNRIVTANSLTIGLRDLYTALYTAEKSMEIKRKKMTLEGDKYLRDKEKLKQGLVTSYVVERSKYNYLKARKELTIHTRNRDNLLRSINSYIGVPQDTKYKKIILGETVPQLELKEVEYYQEKAKNERMEMLRLKNEIKLKEMEKSILEINNVYKEFDNAEIEYENLLKSLEILNLEILKTEIMIETDIKNAINDIKVELSNLRSLKDSLEIQKGKLELLRQQHENGLIQDLAVKEMEIAFEKLEIAYKSAIFNYNTKVIKLENAAGVGPSYIGGTGQ